MMHVWDLGAVVAASFVGSTVVWRDMGASPSSPADAALGSDLTEIANDPTYRPQWFIAERGNNPLLNWAQHIGLLKLASQEDIKEEVAWFTARVAESRRLWDQEGRWNDFMLEHGAARQRHRHRRLLRRHDPHCWLQHA